ncbi:MAG: hypothetical protein KAJ18_09400 [Candidatus Omnitrophica bacterium]|nr:hypothetical protein [Candidatus Omnitrophota bacterium]
MSEISFKLKKMMGFNWDILSDDQRDNTIKYIFNFPLEGDIPDRFGFVKCEEINKNQIYGYFTQEFEEEKHRYNNQKKEEKYVDQPFEDFFFIILFDEGLCLIQSRNIKNVSMSKIEGVFTRALKSVFDEMGVEFYSLEDFSAEIGKDEFINIFNTENIISMEVDSLKGQSVPDHFKIFNPHVDKDAITRALFNDDFKRLDKTYLSTDNNGGLQDLKTSKIMLHTGNPKEIGYVGRDGGKVIITDKFGPSVKLDIDIESPKINDVRKELDKIISNSRVRRTGNPKQTKNGKQTSLLSLKVTDDD